MMLLTEAVGLLERGLGYALGAVGALSRNRFSDPTPCRAWDVEALLWHLNSSLDTLSEAIEINRVALLPPLPRQRPGVDCPVDGFRDRSHRLMGSWATTGARDPNGPRSGPHDPSPSPIAIGECELTAGVVAAAGALEVTVHGWDLSRAAGTVHPIPAALAAELLPVAEMLVTDDERPEQFAEPLLVSAAASPADRLLSYLGRNPSWSPELLG